MPGDIVFDLVLMGELLELYPAARPDATEHLDFAIGDFRDMKMQPSRERAAIRVHVIGFCEIAQIESQAT